MNSGHSITIWKSDLKSLKPTKWLNNDVINLHFWALNEREKQRNGKRQKSSKHGKSRCHFFQTHFLHCLKAGERYNHKTVATFYTCSINIFSNKKLFFPIHLPGHWICMVVHPKEHKIVMHNSEMLGNTNIAFS